MMAPTKKAPTLEGANSNRGAGGSLGAGLLDRRMVFTFNEKGGVGKTTFARGLLDVYQKHKIDCMAFDADTRSPQLKRYYDSETWKVEKIDIFNIGKYDALLNSLEARKPAVVLVDLPGTSGEAFEAMEKDLGLFSEVAGLGYSTTMVSVISRTKDCLDSLDKLMEYCSDNVDYAVVINEFFGNKDNFSRWDNSETKDKFLSRKGIVLIMPELYEEIYDIIDQKSLPYTKAVEDTDITRTNRSRVFRWLEKLEAALVPATKILGLPLAKGGEI